MKLEGLEDSFDNEGAERMLGLYVGKVTTTSDLVRKAMYDFDLDTPEGIDKLMSLLPIMDPEILKDIMTEIWPGYPTDIDARRHRMEIKGYLKDYLESYDEQEGQLDETAPEAPVPPGLDAAPISEGSGSEDQASVAPDAGV
jgi:hypothetical protein